MALFDDDMSDVSSFDDEEDEDENDSSKNDSLHNGEVDAGVRSQQTAQAIAERHGCKDAAGSTIDERPITAETRVAQEDESTPALPNGSSSAQEQSPLTARLQDATRFNVHPPVTHTAAAGSLLHSLHLAQTSDSVETIPSLSRVTTTDPGGNCVAQSFFTCATYQQQGVDKSLKGAGGGSGEGDKLLEQQQSPGSASPCQISAAAAAATGVPAGTTASDTDESMKSGKVFLFCVEQQRVSTHTAAMDSAPDDASEPTRLFLLDEIDAGSAVFDVAWLCDGAWSACPMMAVACADSAVRLFTLVQPTDLHDTPPSKGGGGSSSCSASPATTGLGEAPRRSQGVSKDRFRQSYTLHLLTSFALPGRDVPPAAPISRDYSGKKGFDNSMVRVLSVRWDRERRQQLGKSKRNVLTTHSDGTAAVWTCAVDNIGSHSRVTHSTPLPAVRLRTLWDAHSYFGAPSEVWTGCFDVHNSNRVFTGADDGKLKLWEWSDDNSPFVLQEHNAGLDGHGVTVIRPHPSGSLLVTGSYDGSVNVWNALCILQGPLRKYSCKGGVWRLQWHPSLRLRERATSCGGTEPAADGLEPRQLLLAACMRGGAHVLDLSQVFPFVQEQQEAVNGTALESGDTIKSPECPESEQLHAWQANAHADGSIVYGADWIFSDRYLAATCSFYDCHLAVWSLDDELRGSSAATRQ